MIEPTIPDITSDDLDLLRAIHHESQQSHRGVTAEMCCVLSNCDTPAQREALVARINRLIAAPLRLLRMDPNDPERVCLSVDGRQVLQAAPTAANEALPAAESSRASTEDDDMAKPLNDLQLTILDALAAAPSVTALRALTTQEVAEAIRQRVGDRHARPQCVGPCLAGLDRRGLVKRFYHPPAADGVMRWYLTQAGFHAAPQADLGHCNACGSVGGEFHAPECPAVDAFTAGRVAGAPEDAAEDSETGEDLEPLWGRGYVVLCCDCLKPLTFEERHYYAGRCERCESAVRYDDPKPETLVEGSGSHRVEVTTLQVAIHPAGTHYQHPASILLSVENDGEGPYLTIKNSGGGLAVEIEDLATLDAVRIQAEKLLAKAQREEGA